MWGWIKGYGKSLSKKSAVETDFEERVQKVWSQNRGYIWL